jgi:hypothetical protein
MQKRTNQSLAVGSLLVTDLFGNRYGDQRTGDRSITNLQRTVKAVRERKQRTIFTDIDGPNGATQAILPYIDTKAFATTMDNYRLYIAAYNEKVRDQNQVIEKHNAAVGKYRSDNELTEVQKEYSRIFCQKHFHNRTAVYNSLADGFNAEYGLLVEKRRIQTVKYGTEQVFHQMLHLYSVQLAKQTTEYLKLGISEARPVKQFEINSHHVSNLKRNGVCSIDVCNATIRNHRERLEECGVLTQYYFRGHKKGVKMHINSQILAVYDAKSGLYVVAENQCFIPESLKDLKDNNEVTGTFKNNIKKKENAGGDFQGKGTPAAGLSIVFYRNIPRQEAKSADTPAAENVKVSATPSEKLHDFIQHPHQLAEQLTAGHFYNYTPIPIRYLYDESKNGTLTRDELKEVIIQDFFKTASRMWRGSSPFTGSWKNALNGWMEKRFTAGNGNGTWTLGKEHMVELLQEYRWRLTNAEKWFRKTGIKPLYPGAYFDFTRQDKKEIGFEYTRKSWLTHMKYDETKPLKLKKQKKAAEARSVQINHSKKYETQIGRFFKGRIDLEQLYDYVGQNLPVHYYEKLTQTILTMSVTKAQYSRGDFADA